MARSRLPFALPTSVRSFAVAALIAAASLQAGCGGSGAFESDTDMFSAASNFASCHQASLGAPGVMIREGREASPSSGWAHSMMAHSMNDPHFIAEEVSEVAVMPQLAGVKTRNAPPATPSPA